MSANAIRLLLIEDNAADVELIQRYLKSEQEVRYIMEEADSLATGLHRLAKEGIDVILLDLALPDSEGLETFIQLHRAFPAIPTLILTGLNDRALGQQAVREGAQDFLIKEKINSEGLDRAICHTLERYYFQEQLRKREEHLRLITEQLPAVLWTTDPSLRFTSSLGAGLIDLHLQPGEAVGMSLLDYFRTGDLNYPPILAHRRALAGESVSCEIEWLGKIYHSHVEPLRNGNDTISGTIGVALDITDTWRMQEERRVAHKIQQGLLPKAVPQFEGFDIGGSSYPAEVTGGDYFDLIPAREGAIWVILGDVSGHGFGAALLMATARAYLRALSKVPIPLPEILSLVNQLLLDDLVGDNFLTLFLGKLDPTDRTLIYTSAGHCTGYLLDREGRLRQSLESTNPPIGVFPDCHFQYSGKISLESGDAILLVTDGLLESFCPDDTLFGPERALGIARLYQQAPAQEIVFNLYHAARAFSQYTPQLDDISAVVIKVRGQL